MATKYLDESGLSYFFSKLKNLFATKDVATQSSDGLMSMADKAKLDELDVLDSHDTGTSIVTVDGSCLESMTIYGKTVVTGTPSIANPATIEAVEPASGTSINISVDGVLTPIDLQGNILVSLPDGTYDELSIDSIGHCVLTKRTGLYHVTGSETAGSRAYGSYIRAVLSDAITDHPSPQYSSASGYCTHAPFVGAPSEQSVHAYTTTTAVVLFDVATNVSQVLAAYAGADVYYKLATPYTVDLGFIEMPNVTSSSQVSVNALVTPTIDVSWWTAFAEPIANAVKCLTKMVVQ